VNYILAVRGACMMLTNSCAINGLGSYRDQVKDEVFFSLQDL